MDRNPEEELFERVAGLGNMSGQECTFSYMYTGQFPLEGKHLKRTSSPQTTSPEQVPLWTSSPAGKLSGGNLSASPKYPEIEKSIIWWKKMVVDSLPNPSGRPELRRP